MAASKTTKVILIIGGILFAVVLVSIIGLVLLADTLGRPSVPNNSVLVLNISGDLPDYSPEDPLAKALGVGQKPSFTSLLTQLRKAKADNRVGAVLLHINMPGIGWGKADELRDAIKDLRTSGKPVYAYMEIGMNRDYYIATAAEKVFLPPPGDLWINGFAAEAMFYKGSLDKLGVEADVIQIGPKYKNAPDQYTKKEMGEGQREVLNAVLDEYQSRFAAAVSESRGKSVQDVAAIVDNAPYNATQAKDQGLIDGAFYIDQVHDELKTRLGYKAEESLRTISGGQYRDIPSDSLGLNNGERVAVVFASGAITTGATNDGPFGGNMVGSDTLVRAINDAAADTTIKAIILRVDSPGGSALASDLMWRAIENAKAKGKPVVVSMSDVAASGGYYISTNANKIVAQPSTLTGSIGVFVGKPVVKGLYDWLGITNEYVMRGKNAGIFRETEKWNPDERAKMEEQANNIYFSNFIPKVAAGRNLNVERANTLGQGRVWTGTQAKANGLVDELGGLEKAIEIAKQLANLPADKDVKRIVFPAPRPFLETVFGSEESTVSAEQKAQRALAESLPADARKALRFAELMDRMKNGEGMMLLPFELEIR